MSFDALGDLNWLAVIVAAIAYFALGAIWYSPPVFGRPWQRAIGWDSAAEPQAMQSAMYAVPFVAYLIAAIALGMLAKVTSTDTFGEGIVLGLVVGIGVALTIQFVTAIFDPKKPQPMAWFVINGAYHLLGLMVAAVILAVWE